MNDPDVRNHLRWLADTYERVQLIRIEAGERIRSVAQGRTAVGAGGPAAEVCADSLLGSIRAGRSPGPVPALGITYRLHHAEERRLRAAMAEALAMHPAWPWLTRVRGIGPTLAAKLLSRLDIERAPTPSSFWSYCGLATIATSDGKRTAPRLERGEKPAFDRYARKVCFQIGCALLRARGAYGEFYRDERGRLDSSRPGWTAGHRHMAALRKTEKLLLAHLWVTWAEQVGLAVRRPYACTRTAAWIPPSSMQDR